MTEGKEAPQAAPTDEAQRPPQGDAPRYNDPAQQPLAVHRPAFDYMPTTFEGALKLADMLASSELVPKAYQGKPANVFVAVQWGHELGMKPLQALQGIAVINGKPSIYGDAGKALLLANGCQIDEEDIAEIRATGVARCTIQRSGRRPVTRTFSLEDAKNAGLLTKDGPWKAYRERQLAWRAFWFCARDAAADILKGMSGAEELADMIDVTPKDGAPNRVAPPQAKSAEGKAAAEPKTTDATDHKTPATAGQITYLRKQQLTGTDGKPALDECIAKFRIPSLDGITLAQWKAIKEWASDPSRPIPDDVLGPEPEGAAE